MLILNSLLNEIILQYDNKQHGTTQFFHRSLKDGQAKYNIIFETLSFLLTGKLYIVLTN